MCCFPLFPARPFLDPLAPVQQPSWDEWVPEDRLKKWNDENIRKQKALIEAQRTRDAAEREAARVNDAAENAAMKRIASTAGKAGGAAGGGGSGAADKRGQKRGRDDMVRAGRRAIRPSFFLPSFGMG